MSLIASFWQNLVLSVINCMYCNCTGIHQIRLEIWPELGLARFLKHGWIQDLPEMELKFGTALVVYNVILTVLTYFFMEHM